MSAPARPAALPSAARTGAAQLALAVSDERRAARRFEYDAAALRAAPEANPEATLETAPTLFEDLRDDWSGLREGAREIALTLLATFAIGFSWAAIEAGRLNGELARASVPPVAPTAHAVAVAVDRQAGPPAPSADAARASRYAASSIPQEVRMR